MKFLGDTTFAIGYSIFANDIHKRPSLSKGYVSKITPFILKTTSTVIAGCSGGGLFNNEGNLIGIIVANTKLERDDGKNVIFPRFNAAIPIKAIYSIIEDYLRNKGKDRGCNINFVHFCVIKLTKNF